MASVGGLWFTTNASFPWDSMYFDLDTLGECIVLWGEPNELSIQHHVYIFMQYV